MFLDIFVFVLTIILIALLPLFTLFLAALVVVKFLLRRLYDSITFCFIKCCARLPTDDTWMAWKVAGPGVSRKYYQTINEADLYVLVVAELEKL